MEKFISFLTFHKIEITCLSFMLLYSVYMTWGKKPILFLNFWRAYSYTVIFGLPIILLAYQLKNIGSTFSMLIIIGTMAFLLSLIIFYWRYINTPTVEFQKINNSDKLSYIFILWLVICLLLGFIVKIFK
jgi:hypothetical protein